MMLNPDPLAALRLKLRRAGYFPIPCEGKAPPLKGWQESFSTNADEITLWSKSWHMARNTGVLCKYTPALDIDLMDENACEAIETLVGHLFEDGRVLIRIGKAPKRLIPLRTETPFKKLILAVTAPNGTKGKLEFLGDGQQYICDGLHPQTGSAYCWHGADHLADVPARDLPLIRDAAHAQEVLDKIGAMLVADHGYTLDQAAKPGEAGDANGGRAGDDWAALIGNINRGEVLHDSLCALAGKYVRSGMSAGAAINALRALMEGSSAPRDDRWRARYGEIPRLVESAEGPPVAPASGLDEWNVGDDPGFIPPREWLLANQFCRGFISSIVAAGGSGKTALRLLQFISLATGRSLCGQHVFRRCRVLLISLEDDRAEMERRIKGVLDHYKIARAELNGWLFCATPKLTKLAVMKGQTRAIGALEGQIRDAIERRKPDLISLDPFIKTHGLEENDSGDMDFVCDLLARIAVEFNTAIDSPHHVHKGTVMPGDADSGRGSSGIKDAARLVYTLVQMSVEEAQAFNINPPERRSYVRLDSAKVNIAPNSSKANWFRLVAVPIGNATEDYPNGDTIQVMEPWSPPDTWAGITDEMITTILFHINAGLVDTDGLPSGERYSNAPNAGERAVWKVVQSIVPDKTEGQCRQIISFWLESGLLYAKDYEDPRQYKKRKGLYVDNTKRAAQAA